MKDQEGAFESKIVELAITLEPRTSELKTT